jgi:hypothetical protein
LSLHAPLTCLSPEAGGEGGIRSMLNGKGVVASSSAAIDPDWADANFRHWAGPLMVSNIVASRTRDCSHFESCAKPALS